MKYSPSINPLFLTTMLEAMESGMGRDEAANDLMSYSSKERKEILAEIPTVNTPEEKMSRFLNLAFFGKQILGEEEQKSKDSLFPSISLYKGEELKKNPYYIALSSLGKFQDGDLTFEFQHYEPFAPFVLDEKRVDDLYNEVTPLGYVSSKLEYPAIRKGKTNWMEVIPHEINTMRDFIAQAQGNILLYGLGLGYVAYMCSLKKEVTSITIVEDDKKVIDVFKAHFLPLFRFGSKIKIVQGDAIAYASSHRNGGYDSLFADLWHNADDGLELYQKLLKAEGASSHSFYWIEKAILVYFRRFLILLLEEECVEKMDDSDYLNPETESDALLAKLHFALKEREIHSEKEILSLLSEASLKKILIQMK